MRAPLILAGLTLLGGCSIAGAGTPSQRDFPVTGFDTVALSGSHDVIVTVGGAPSVRAEGDSDDLDRLDIRIDGNQLRIANRADARWTWGSSRGVTIHVTVPALAGASIGGSGDMRIDRVEGAAFSGNVAGSGDLHIANLRVAAATLGVTGSGGIEAQGAAQTAALSVTGSGDLDGARLEAGDATVNLVGSGDIAVRALRTVTGQLTGSGDVDVSGPARCTVTKRGSGDVTCHG